MTWKISNGMASIVSFIKTGQLMAIILMSVNETMERQTGASASKSPIPINNLIFHQYIKNIWMNHSCTRKMLHKKTWIYIVRAQKICLPTCQEQSNTDYMKHTASCRSEDFVKWLILHLSCISGDLHSVVTKTSKVYCTTCSITYMVYLFLVLFLLTLCHRFP